MEVFPAHLDRKFVKIIKIITICGFPILGPIFGPLWALFSAVFPSFFGVNTAVGFQEAALALHAAEGMSKGADLSR